MKYGIYAAVAGIALMAAAPASALTTISACSPSFPNPDASACAGYYTTNLLNANDAADQLTALQSLGYSGSFDGTKAGWNTLVSGGNVLPSLSGTTTIDFGKMLYGITYIGAHFGSVTDGSTLQNVSVFWKFDFGTTGVSSITVPNGTGLSDAALYGTGTGSGVPEPATWGMMLVGFAGVGFAMRRKQKASGELLQLA